MSEQVHSWNLEEDEMCCDISERIDRTHWVQTRRVWRFPGTRFIGFDECKTHESFRNAIRKIIQPETGWFQGSVIVLQDDSIHSQLMQRELGIELIGQKDSDGEFRLPSPEIHPFDMFHYAPRWLEVVDLREQARHLSLPSEVPMSEVFMVLRALEFHGMTVHEGMFYFMHYGHQIMSPGEEPIYLEEGRFIFSADDDRLKLSSNSDDKSLEPNVFVRHLPLR